MTTEEAKVTTMKAAVWHKVGDPLSEEVLSVAEDVPIPEPKNGEVLLKVYAAAINPVDWKVIKVAFPHAKGPIGCDVSGIVEKIGPDTTTDLKVGDATYADAFATMGTFAEYAVVQSITASKKPSNISFAEAASLPLAGLTALQGLVHYLQVKPGQRFWFLVDLEVLVRWRFKWPKHLVLRKYTPQEAM